MKAKVIGRVEKDVEGACSIPLVVGEGPSARTIKVDLDPREFTPDSPAPFRLNDGPGSDGIWVFRDSVVSVADSSSLPSDEVLLRVKHAVLRGDKALKRIEREVEAFENLQRLADARRERIPDHVRLFVWQRDEGKCVRCGSTERLEFDHIIPIAKGGGSTERNIQLLCEGCNRSKGVSI